MSPLPPGGGEAVGSTRLFRLLPGSWAHRIQINDQVSLLASAGAVGVVGAGLSILFRGLVEWLQFLLWRTPGDIAEAVSTAGPGLRLALPAAGGVLAGVTLVYGVRVARAAQGWDILEAVVLRDGILKFRPALIKSLASLITIATGGSVGREGTMVLLSSTLASKMGQWLNAPTRRLRVLTACGVASGIAAAYNAPIAGSLFAMEIILGNFAMDVFAPLVFASVIATLVSRGLYGPEPIFHVPAFELVSAWELGGYLVLGIAGGLLASLFMAGLRASAGFFRRLKLALPLQMGLVGLVLGLVILKFPEVCGNGRGLADAILDASYLWKLAAALLILKLALTALTVGSGAVGGVLTPTLFLGAALGYGLGTLLHFLTPQSVANPGAYALVGMGCLLAGTTHAPIMAILMIFEMSLNYSIVLPLMLSCAAASLVARGISSASIYTEALARKSGLPATAEAQVMTSLSVREIMRRDYETVPPDLPLPKVLDRFLGARRNHLYVVDGEGRFLGAISLHDLKEALREADQASFVIALDLMKASFQMTVPEEKLDRVMERFWAEDCERIPVVDSFTTRRLLGTVSKRDILGVYTLEVLQRKSLVTKFRTEADERGEGESTYVELPADWRVEGVPVGPALAGRTVAEARLRERFGATVLLIKRRDEAGQEVRLVPGPETRLQEGDRLVVFAPEKGLSGLRAS